MPDPVMHLDAAHSSLIVRTSVAGFFSAFAHSLELRATTLSGEGTDGDTPSARVRIPIAALRVVGAIKGGAVDRSALSADEVREIERKIQSEVFAGLDHIDAAARLDGQWAHATFTTPSGEHASKLRMTLLREGEQVTLSGGTQLSLSALGIAPIKGPAGVFRLDDKVSVSFRLLFKPAASA